MFTSISRFYGEPEVLSSRFILLQSLHTKAQSSISQCLSRVFERDLGGCGFGPEGVFTAVPGLWTRVDTPPRRLKKSPLLFCAKRLFALGGCRCIRAKLRIAFGRVGCRCKSSRPPVWPPSRGRATQASTSCSSRWLPSEHKKKNCIKQRRFGATRRRTLFCATYRV